MKIISVIWLMLGLSWGVHAANENTTVYYWTDANGVTHFSDTPVAGKQTQSKQVEIANPPVNNPNPIVDKNTPEPKETAPNYSLSISSPLPGETIRDNEGKISVQTQITPELAVESAKLMLYIDAQSYPCDAKTLHCQATNIDRGAHQLRTELLSKDGKILASSESITVYLFRVAAKR